MATFSRGLLLTLLLAHAGDVRPPEECPDVDYVPVGPIVEDAESCDADTCPLSCGGTRVDCGGAVSRDAIACEPCDEVVHYLATECQWCYLEDVRGRVETSIYCMSDQK